MKALRTSLRSAVTRLVGTAASVLAGASDAAPLEAQRDRLSARRNQLTARLDAATVTAEGAHAMRRALYVGEGLEIDEVALARAERACNEANGTKAGCEDALEHVTGQLAAVERAILERDSRAERAQAAKIRAGEVDAFAAAGDDLAEATRLLGLAYERFRLASYAAIIPDPTGWNHAGELVGEVRGHILHAVFPGDFVRPALSHAPDLAAVLTGQLDRMREEIGDIRDSGLVLPLRPAAHVPAPTFPEVPIAIYRPAFFLSALGSRIDLVPGGVVVPEPIAIEAIRQGVGFGAESQEGRQIIRAALSQPGAWIGRSDDGAFYPRKVRGIHDEGGERAPAPEPPADLGMLPSGELTVRLLEAAQ